VPEDDVETTLARMKDARARRLPVVGFGNTVVGLLSLNDSLLATGFDKPVRADAVLDALRVICGRYHPAPRIVAA
jgi:hypothetical protein